jgi:TfoX/Sxy family transcriptional regulator of competence genes
MAGGTSDAERAFERLVPALLAEPNVSEGTGFGSNPGLRVGGKVFAMLVKGELVVKLPRERVDELVASSVGARFDPRGDGRLMKEWVTVPARHSRRWKRLAGEALRFVALRSKP